jgi:flagellar biosynthesis/type III secretory pathway protein FliH
MGHEVLSKTDYQYVDQGYLVDNGPWQEEIKKRIERQNQSIPKNGRSWPTLGTNEFQPMFLPENPEGQVGSEVGLDLSAIIGGVENEERNNEKQDVESQVREIIDQARLEAEKIIQAAKVESEKDAFLIKESAIEQGKKEGFEEGRREGFEQGSNEGKNGYSELVKNLTSIMAEMGDERKELIGELQPILVELVGESLKKCLKREAENGSMVVEFVKDALLKAQDRVELKLHLNPLDADEIESHKKNLQLSVGTKALVIVPDARIDRGGCLLETEAGTVDVRIPTIIKQVKDSFARDLK